jgi:phosphatidylethanolamine/phosphatidyl-N-methylethanolamine N-methyltransferase
MQASQADLDNDMVARAYNRWAPVYDMVFGPVFERGRKAAITAAEQVGGRILEVGVGTGISLPDYASNNTIVGVDISEMMLRKARERVAELSLHHVEQLSVMDARHLNSGCVVRRGGRAIRVTAVPDPEGTLDEFARVLKPGGEIILLSRVGAEAGLRRTLEHWFAPAARKLGGGPNFPGSGMQRGRLAPKAWIWSSVAPCRRWGTSR